MSDGANTSSRLLVINKRNVHYIHYKLYVYLYIICITNYIDSSYVESSFYLQPDQGTGNLHRRHPCSAAAVSFTDPPVWWHASETRYKQTQHKNKNMLCPDGSRTCEFLRKHM